MKLSTFKKMINLQANFFSSKIGTWQYPGIIVQTDQVEKVMEFLKPIFGEKQLMVVKWVKGMTIYDQYKYELQEKFGFDADYLLSHCFVFHVYRREPKNEAQYL